MSGAFFRFRPNQISNSKSKSLTSSYGQLFDKLEDMAKCILILFIAIQSLGAIKSKKESDTEKLNRKVIEEMKLVVQFAKDSRKTYKDLHKRSDLSKRDKENLVKIEQENQKLLKQTQENIKKLEAQD